MPLLADLESLDLSGILNARASISVSVEGADLQAVIDGGAAQSALAGLGGSIGELTASIDSPEALLEPLVAAVGSLADRLGVDELPLDDYLGAVREGAAIVASLLGALGGDPDELFSGDAPFGEALDRVRAQIGDNALASLGEVGQLKRLVDTVEAGIPTGPGQLAEIAVEILLPFPAGALRTMRDNLGRLFELAAGIELPSTRIAGLLGALDRVRIAADSADAAALELALGELERVRLNTVASIGGDLRTFAARIDGLGIDGLLAPVVSAGASLRTTGEGILEFLETWRRQLAAIRVSMEELDPAAFTAQIGFVVDFLETHARLKIGQPIDREVARLEGVLRNLLAGLPLRRYRAELSAFFRSIVEAIEAANLDGPAETVRGLLDEIQSLATTDLTGAVQAALGEVQATLDAALDGVISALEAISTEVDAVAGNAEAILGQAVAAIEGFATTVTELTLALETLGVQEAAQQVVDELAELRETAETVLSVAPVPDSLKPAIDQLIQALEGIDFDVVFQPVREAMAQFELPDQVSADINAGLAAVAEKMENLIPAELIASIDAEVQAALDVVRDFDPSSLLQGVTGFLDEAADFVEGLDPTPAAEAVRGPFDAILGAVDQVHPRRLLGPAIEAYDELLGQIPEPSSEGIVNAGAAATEAIGDAVGRTVSEPIRALTGAEVREPGPQEPVEPTAEDVPTPGDVVRLFGYLPERLRQALAALEAGPAGEALAALDGLCGGLAGELRRVQGAVWEIEDRLTGQLDALLAPLGSAQIGAQVAIRANFSADSEGIDVDAAMAAVAGAGAAALRSALAQPASEAHGRARAAARATGGSLGAALGEAAEALEGCMLSRLTGDLDDLLAALDFEPLALELDDMARVALLKGQEALGAAGDEIRSAIERLLALAEQYNPGAQLQKFVVVMDVLRQELELLNPRRLAAELGEIHAAIRAVIAAYDPAVFAAEIQETLVATGGALRALDPATLLGDLSFLDATVARVEAASPTAALAGVGESLAEVGASLQALDPAGLLAAVEGLGPDVVDAFETAAEGIRREIIALLEAIRYASGGASVSVSASVSVGGG